MNKFSIQDAINWIEGNLETATLDKISEYIGYSKFHTSREFKKYTDSTLRNYITLRRLSVAAKQLRDTNVRVIDCAFNHGFQSQEAFTKSFNQAFGINPGEYQQSNKAIPLVLKKDILFPEYLSKKGELIMVKDEMIKIRLETVPKHKFFYFELDGIDNYIDFWQTLEEKGYDCNRLHGVFSSIEGLYPEGYGAFTQSGYVFGKDAPLDFELNEKGIKEKIIEEQQVLIFEHPGFSEAEFGDALNQVRRIALEEFDFEMKGYKIDKSFVNAYEHSGLEICFYYIRVPLKKVA